MGNFTQSSDQKSSDVFTKKRERVRIIRPSSKVLSARKHRRRFRRPHINDNIDHSLAKMFKKRGKKISEKKMQRIRTAVNFSTIFGMIALAVGAFFAYRAGLLTDKAKLEAFLTGAGIWGPVIFVFIQTIQCVFPILPGGFTLLIGVVVFGPWMGFLYNYIGIVLGEILDFGLARLYGKPLVRALVSEKSFNKYIGWMDRNEKQFNRFFIIMMVLPGMPDDLICMIAGLSKMEFKWFLLHLLWTKIPAMLLYTLFLDKVVDFGIKLFQSVFH